MSETETLLAGLDPRLQTRNFSGSENSWTWIEVHPIYLAWQFSGDNRHWQADEIRHRLAPLIRDTAPASLTREACAAVAGHEPTFAANSAEELEATAGYGFEVGPAL